MRDPDSQDDISKERFEGTVLKAISKDMKMIKKEPREGGGSSECRQTFHGQVRNKFAVFLLFSGLKIKICE